MKESAIGRMLGRVRSLSKEEIRRKIKEVWESNRLTFEKAEEAKKHILTISLQDYAANQGKNPSDYLTQQLSSYFSGYNEEWCVVKSLGAMFDKMENGGFEAVVNSRFIINHDYFYARGSPPVNATATGTALKLKENSEK